MDTSLHLFAMLNRYVVIRNKAIKLKNIIAN